MEWRLSYKEVKMGSAEKVISTVFPINMVTQLYQGVEKFRQVERDGPQGWSKSIVDPMNLLFAFPSLHIKNGLVLRAYQFRSGPNGNGFVWAMPENLVFPEPEECPRLNDRFLGPPKPQGALDDIMEAIDGDKTPWSYFSASFFAREIAEFGAMWHGCHWSTHIILGDNPLSSPPSYFYGNPEKGFRKPDEWKWLERKPLEWRPQVSENRDIVTVTFYTYSGLAINAIYRFVDKFKQGVYCFETDKKMIAKGRGGYIF